MHVCAPAIVAPSQAKKKRDSTAVVALYNKIVDLPDPCDLTSDIVASVGTEFGINMRECTELSPAPVTSCMLAT